MHDAWRTTSGVLQGPLAPKASPLRSREHGGYPGTAPACGCRCGCGRTPAVRGIVPGAQPGKAIGMQNCCASRSACSALADGVGRSGLVRSGNGCYLFCEIVLWQLWQFCSFGAWLTQYLCPIPGCASVAQWRFREEKMNSSFCS